MNADADDQSNAQQQGHPDPVRSRRSRRRAMTVSALTAFAVVFSPAVPAARAAEQGSEPSWKCGVVIPFAKAAAAAARLTLQATNRAVPGAERLLSDARAALKRAEESAREARDAATADPSNTALEDTAKSSSAGVIVRKVAVTTAAIALQTVKLALPPASSLVRTSEAKLAELNASC